jgi:hypothetical protein
MPVVARKHADPVGETALAAGSLAVAAGVVHLALVVPHLREATVLGLLFAVAAVGEIGWGTGVVPLRRSRAVGLCGVGLLASILAAWLMSRTVGLPFGDDAWKPEPVGLLDSVTGAAELLAAWLALRLRGGRGASTAVVYAGLLLAVIVLLMLASGAAHAH